MKLKNNSNNEWLSYNCGDNIFVDILSLAVIDVPDKAGQLLLRNLGAPGWLVKVDNDWDANLVNNLPAPADNLPTIEKVLCDICGSKSKRHKKGCSKVSKT